MTDIKHELKELVARLQGAVQQGTLTPQVVAKETAVLARLGYEYDASKFPELLNTAALTSTSITTPGHLAKALL